MIVKSLFAVLVAILGSSCTDNSTYVKLATDAKECGPLGGFIPGQAGICGLYSNHQHYRDQIKVTSEDAKKFHCLKQTDIPVSYVQCYDTVHKEHVEKTTGPLQVYHGYKTIVEPATADSQQVHP